MEFLWLMRAQSCSMIGALVEVRRRVVRRRADEVHAARVRPVVRLRTDEGRQERVVDVDDAVRVGRAKFVRDDLHVAREHDEVDLLSLRSASSWSALATARFVSFVTLNTA